MLEVLKFIKAKRIKRRDHCESVVILTNFTIMKKILFTIMIILTLGVSGQPCDGNNGNNHGTGNNGNGNGNNPCHPAPMPVLPLFLGVVVFSLGYTYWSYKQRKKLEDI